LRPSDHEGVVPQTARHCKVPFSRSPPDTPDLIGRIASNRRYGDLTFAAPVTRDGPPPRVRVRRAPPSP
jgi:hypothetical protein